MIQWGLESGWGGEDISLYYNPANQAAGCNVGAVCGQQPNKLPAFCTIKDGVKVYSALIIKGYPHVMWAFSDNGNGTNGLKPAAGALGQGYYSGYNGGTITFCGGSYTLTSSSGARIWATSKYGSPAGADIISTFNANSNLQALNTIVKTNPLPGF